MNTTETQTATEDAAPIRVTVRLDYLERCRKRDGYWLIKLAQDKADMLEALAWYSGCIRMLRDSNRYHRLEVFIDSVRAGKIETSYPAEAKEIRDGFYSKGSDWLAGIESQLAWKYHGALLVLQDIKRSYDQQTEVATDGEE